jgi:DNA-binding SARP family transcriptional activator
MVRLLLLGTPQLTGSLPVQPGRVTQPRPMALLAVLASAGRHGVTRDRAVALLWGDSSEARARHHLSDVLYIVHRELGPDAIEASGQTLRLNESAVATDLSVFSRAVQAHQYEAALAEYRGPFLDGFHLAGATAFEEWVTAQRQHLKRQYGDCVESLASAAEAAGDLKEAGRWWRLLLEQDPFNSRVAVSLARSLLANGDRGNALEALESHRQLLRRELDADTGYEVRAFLEETRTGTQRAGVPSAVSGSARGNGGTQDQAAAAVTDCDDRERWWLRRRVPLVWLSVPVMAGAGLAWFLTTRQPPVPVDPDLLAVPPFHAMTTSPAAQKLAADVPDLIWATVTGEFGLRVSDPSALERRWRKAGGDVGDPLGLGDMLGLARASGAGSLVVGSVAGTEAHLRLTASLITVPSGEIRVAPTTVEGDYGDFPDLVDRLVVLLLAQDGGVPAHRFPMLAAHDPAAVQAYLSGLRARRRVVFESDWFARALELDSTLLLAALARYEAGESDQSTARLIWDHRAQLHPRDAALVVPLAGWRFGASRTYTERIAQYGRLVQGTPAWDGPLNEQAVALFVFGRGAGIASWSSAAREASEQLVAQDPGDLPAWFRLFSLAVFEGDTVAARRYATAYGEQEIRVGLESGVGWLFSWTMRLRLALLVGDSVEAARLWAHRNDAARIAVRHPMETPPIYASELAPLVGGLLVDGRGLVALDSFMRELRAVDSSPSFPALNWARVRGHAGEYRDILSALYDAMPPVTAAGLRVRDALFLGEPESDAERAAAAFLDRVARGVLAPPPDSTDPTPAHVGVARARCWNTLWSVAHGDVRGARATAVALRGTPLPYRHAVCAALIDALVARHAGDDARAAVRRLDSVVREFPMEGWPYGRGVRDLTPGVDNLIVARLLAEQGDTTRALQAIRRGPWGPVAIERGPQWALSMLPEFLREEGRLAAAAGDTAGAIRAYRQYHALREGTSIHPAELVDVQRELRGLLSGPSPPMVEAARANSR